MGGENWTAAYPHWLARLGTTRMDDKETLARLMAKIARHCLSGDRGVMFLGVPGDGKTTRLRFVASEMGIRYAHARDLGMECAGRSRSDDDFTERCNLPVHGSVTGDPWRRRYDLIIDDLGTEPSARNTYGNREDAMALILDARYEAFASHRWRTFLSTNLTREQLERAYGPRTCSRLREMCIFVALGDIDYRGAN